MPTVVKCGGCGKILEEWETMPALGYYEELYHRFDGHCPSCGHRLPEPRGLSKMIKVEIGRAGVNLHRAFE